MWMINEYAYNSFLTSGKMEISMPLLRIALEISPWRGFIEINNLKTKYKTFSSHIYTIKNMSK